MKNKILYFAYGSNLSEEQMKKRCKDSKLISNGKLNGWTICFPSISYARSFKGVMGIRRDEKNYVEGLIYELSEKDLELLDGFEGADKTNGNYKRKLVTINTNNTEEKCFIYENIKDKQKNYMPSYGYLMTVLYGMLKNKLSYEYIINTMFIAQNGYKPSITVILIYLTKYLYAKLTGWRNTNSYFPKIK
jgi:gamma-glutamylcyclotransferase (GGCT)/AIG2-like uncharacterized protein YtfP